ncbi:IstB-like ATP binding protein [uncultured archaeon]|nr:IstB-like ATP binding protein [uncultured archaeon]
MEEALVNAVYHRSYEIREPIKVHLYPDRMEIISYPGPVAGIEMHHLQTGGTVPPVQSRNRRIGEFQPSIDKAVIGDLALLRFIYNAENVVFLGPPGVGKSHLAVAIGIEAVQAGLSVYFANAGILIERLKKANSEGLLEDKIKTLAKYKLLIIDDMAYLPFDSDGANFFFQLNLFL